MGELLPPRRVRGRIVKIDRIPMQSQGELDLFIVSRKEREQILVSRVEAARFECDQQRKLGRKLRAAVHAQNRTRIGRN